MFAELEAVLGDGGLYIGGGTIVIIILFLIAWALLRRG